MRAEVKFVGLCEARGIPVLHIGVADSDSGAVEIQDVASWSIADLLAGMGATLPQLFSQTPEVAKPFEFSGHLFGMRS